MDIVSLFIKHCTLLEFGRGDPAPTFQHQMLLTYGVARRTRVLGVGQFSRGGGQRFSSVNVSVADWYSMAYARLFLPDGTWSPVYTSNRLTDLTNFLPVAWMTSLGLTCGDIGVKDDWTRSRLTLGIDCAAARIARSRLIRNEFVEVQFKQIRFVLKVIMLSYLRVRFSENAEACFVQHRTYCAATGVKGRSRMAVRAIV